MLYQQIIPLLQAPASASKGIVHGHALLSLGMSRAICLIHKARRANEALENPNSKIRAPPEIAVEMATAVDDARILVVECAETLTSFSGSTVQAMNCVGSAKRMHPSVVVDVCSLGDVDSALFKQVAQEAGGIYVDSQQTCSNTSLIQLFILHFGAPVAGRKYILQHHDPNVVLKKIFK